MAALRRSMIAASSASPAISWPAVSCALMRVSPAAILRCTRAATRSIRSSASSFVIGRPAAAATLAMHS
jgi:hypothetical protein